METQQALQLVAALTEINKTLILLAGCSAVG